MTRRQIIRQSSLYLTLANSAGVLLAGPAMPLMALLFVDQVFAASGIALPALTVAMLGVPWQMFLLGAAFLAAVLVVLELALTDKRVMLAMNIAAAVLVGIYLLVWLAAIVLPLVKIIIMLVTARP